MGDADQGPDIECPVCGGERFRDERGKWESERSLQRHRIDLKICENCSFVLPFHHGLGSGWWLGRD